MNRLECDVLLAAAAKRCKTQRELAEACGYALGAVNRAVNQLRAEGYLENDLVLTHRAEEILEQRAPKRAVILAAGFGMRMVPINMETPKGLIEVHGEPLIERLISQLHEAGVREIRVVVGFMKERFEYLIDTYGVKLVVNPEYAVKNNLHSMARVHKHLDNCYVLPCDLWFAENPFRSRELYSWYMVSQNKNPESPVKVNRKQELALTKDGDGNGMIGLCYLQGEDARQVSRRVAEMDSDSRYDGAFWEEALYQDRKMGISARVALSESVVEINTYEQLRELDSHSNQLRTDAIAIIAQALSVPEKEITDITVLKKGMTNRSFLFRCGNQKYIMRIPGEGTDRLINRREEAAVYHAIDGFGICDDIIYINPENGYKITRYLEGARVCDPEDPEDLKKCMEKLRSFHQKKLKVPHRFDIFGQIEFYESLWEGQSSVYRDYSKTKEQVLSLQSFVESVAEPECLTHIDAVPDNFLFVTDDRGVEEIRLIDWEYAGMQDPHVDIAMFCIYALYDREQVDRLIDIYFEEDCPAVVRTKIYAYIAACGLLWSNWCEYKRNLGVEFGEYSICQYRYAKDYYRIVVKELSQTAGGSECIE